MSAQTITLLVAAIMGLTGGTLPGLVIWLTGRKGSKAKDRAAELRADVDLNKLVFDLQGTVSRLGVRQQEYENYINALHRAIGREPDEVQARIFAQVMVKRPNGGHA